MIMTDTGPIVILTSHTSLQSLERSLAGKGIDKFLACEIPIELAEERYGTHFSVVKSDLRESDNLRILDEDGTRVFKRFRFDELAAPTRHELPVGRHARTAISPDENAKPELPRYFMRLTNGRQVLDNHEGIDLPGAAAAREVALGVARGLRNGAAMNGWNWAGWFVIILDAHGNKIDELAITAA
jgi:hypothetical protein